MFTAMDQRSGIVHLERTQNFPKNYHFLRLGTHAFICILTLHTSYLYGVLEKYWVMIHF